VIYYDYCLLGYDLAKSVDSYQRFEATSCVHLLEVKIKMAAEFSSEMLEIIYNTTWRNRLQSISRFVGELGARTRYDTEPIDHGTNGFLGSIVETNDSRYLPSLASCGVASMICQPP
jgi:hypothetical protein